jgi:hypothetical protein
MASGMKLPDFSVNVVPFRPGFKLFSFTWQPVGLSKERNPAFSIPLDYR